MKKGFYFKMAFDNLIRSRQFYIPNILTGAGLVACFYIVFTLSRDGRLKNVKGGVYIPTFMGMGVIVTAILSTILILYINSFIMKQRKAEFGLINVLGMEKKHVGRLLFTESLYSSLTSVVSGLLFGILFYKFCTLIICKLLATDAVAGFYYIRGNTIIPTALFFLILYLLNFILNRFRIGRLKPIEMLKSTNTGEKEPRIRWIFLVIGLAALGAGYYLAVAIKSPLQAINYFFLAVLLVILGTYFLFIAGTIAVLKYLKKKKNYYYDKKHMPVVAGLLFRMKQNAVGLASITILATAVLVMMSSTVSLYAGMEKTLKNNYPEDVYLSGGYYLEENIVTIPSDIMTEFIYEAAGENGLEIESCVTQNYFSAAFLLDGTELVTDQSNVILNEVYDKIIDIVFLTKDMYAEITGENLQISGNEIAVCKMNGVKAIPFKELSLGDVHLEVAKELPTFPIRSDMTALIDCYGVVVADEENFERLFEIQASAYDTNAAKLENRVSVKFVQGSDLDEMGEEFLSTVWKKMRDYSEEMSQTDRFVGYKDSIWEAKESLYGMYGTMLFLGMLLGLVFLFATALIIYYKQISEGYEDRERFRIMQKLGLTETEVNKIVGNQMKMVFFMPLVVAVVHMIFASFILVRLLKIFMLPSVWIFVSCTFAVVVIFALVYILLYHATAKTYVKIVWVQ